MTSPLNVKNINDNFPFSDFWNESPQTKSKMQAFAIRMAHFCGNKWAVDTADLEKTFKKHPEKKSVYFCFNSKNPISLKTKELNDFHTDEQKICHLFKTEISGEIENQVIDRNPYTRKKTVVIILIESLFNKIFKILPQLTLLEKIPVDLCTTIFNYSSILTKESFKQFIPFHTFPIDKKSFEIYRDEVHEKIYPLLKENRLPEHVHAEIIHLIFSKEYNAVEILDRLKMAWNDLNELNLISFFQDHQILFFGNYDWKNSKNIKDILTARELLVNWFSNNKSHPAFQKIDKKIKDKRLYLFIEKMGVKLKGTHFDTANYYMELAQAHKREDYDPHYYEIFFEELALQHFITAAKEKSSDSIKALAHIEDYARNAKPIYSNQYYLIAQAHHFLYNFYTNANSEIHIEFFKKFFSQCSLKDKIRFASRENSSYIEEDICQSVYKLKKSEKTNQNILYELDEFINSEYIPLNIKKYIFNILEEFLKKIPYQEILNYPSACGYIEKKIRLKKPEFMNARIYFQKNVTNPFYPPCRKPDEKEFLIKNWEKFINKLFNEKQA